LTNQTVTKHRQPEVFFYFSQFILYFNPYSSRQHQNWPWRFWHQIVGKHLLSRIKRLPILVETSCGYF
jgi:hypothetical protein